MTPTRTPKPPNLQTLNPKTPKPYHRTIFRTARSESVSSA